MERITSAFGGALFIASNAVDFVPLFKYFSLELCRKQHVQRIEQRVFIIFIVAIINDWCAKIYTFDFLLFDPE